MVQRRLHPVGSFDVDVQRARTGKHAAFHARLLADIDLVGGLGRATRQARDIEGPDALGHRFELARDCGIPPGDPMRLICGGTHLIDANSPCW